MILETLKNYVIQGEIPGAAIRVRKDGKIVAEGYFGYEDIEKKRRINEKTVYRLMSMTKPMSAVVVMKYVEKGLLSLDYREELFEPLQIKGASFVLPEEKKEHLCCMCDYVKGKLVLSSDILWPLIEAIPGKRYCASAGLYSTLDAYDRFAEMMLQNGTWKG